MVDFNQIITKNEKMLSTINVAKKIAASDISVLITGEEGVGKNLLAHAIHDFSNRREGPFVSVNCSAIPPSLLNAELFGAPEGSGKNKSPRGQLELANHGTLFLNEIGEINLATQARFFQAIESKHYKKEGTSQNVELDVRIISAASSNLIVKVEEGQFRMDLYYRIREMSLEIPPLRERKEDIPLLMDYFVKQYAVDFGKKIQGISDVALNFLLSHEWKGNVRELRNVIRTAVALCEKDRIWLEDIPLKMEFGKETSATTDLMNIESYSLKEVERVHILKVLNHCRWNKSRAAKLLKISRPRLDRKIQEYNFRKPDKKKRSRRS